ncbi:MAG: putative toxin-antitoxin system toxin component, PIN family [Chloroflexota bacterium]|nr:putative toxin-antitoxin system toxin component, PIN family [Chloroflexota bacterium]
MNLRAVLDTNVLISGLIGTTGAPRQIMDAWLDGRYTLVTSLYLVEELAHVLSYPRIADRLVREMEAEAILAALLSQADVTPGRLRLPGVTRDPKDDAVAACAVEGDADYVVSGDRDLLVLEAFKGVAYVTPRCFMEILDAYTR